MPTFDYAIIGSGLGGLICGYILSKEGNNVCVIEKNDNLGGCIQNFVRDSSIFDTGGHYIGEMNPGQSLYRYFKYFGLIGKLKLKKLDENGFDRISFENDPSDYGYAMGHQNFIESLAAKFPKEREALKKYCAKLSEVGLSFNLFDIDSSNTQNGKMDFYTDNAYEYIRSITTDYKLQNVLAGTNLLYTGVRKKTPLFAHALINFSFIESAWRCVDGNSQIAELLADDITRNGGTVMTGSKVINLSCDTEKIRYAIIENGEKIEAKNFISNVHPATTLGMIDTPLIRKVYRERINHLENTISVFTLYITLKPNTFKYLNHNCYHYKNEDVWAIDYYSEQKWPECYMMVTPATSKSAEYADGIIVMCPMKYDEVKPWENTTIENRGDGYLEFKQNKAEKLLGFIEKKYPGIRQKIKNYYTSTPLTYRDYIASKEGSIYGVLKDCNEPLKSYIAPRTKIPNLFFAGQNINNLHGVLGVTIGAVVTCTEILGFDYLMNKIKNAE